MGAETISTYCALCISRCGCIATVKDGRLVAVEADPSHPTGSAICIKAKTAPEFVHHRDRLGTPLLRTKPKGSSDPGFRPIGWAEALDLAAARLAGIKDAFGPEAVAFGVATPSGTAIADSFGWVHRLAHAFGSPNMVFATENCNWHKDFTPMLTWGAGIGMPDYARSGLILLWGFNPTATWLSQVGPIRAAQRRGAKLVVVDPRKEGLARSADIWLGINPGSDGALALGLCHLLLESRSYDHEFVRYHTNGGALVRDDNGALLAEADLAAEGSATCPLVWDEAGDRVAPFRRDRPGASPIRPALQGSYPLTVRGQRVIARPVLERLKERCAAYTPDRVEALSAVPRDEVRRLAGLIATARPVSFFTWTGTAQHSNATGGTRAINVLYALTGGLDARGGNVWHARPPIRDVAGFEWVSPATRSRTLGMEKRPLGPPRRGWVTSRDLFQTIVSERPYPVKAFLSFGGNFALTKPDTRSSRDALRKLDFFALTEQFLTPSCAEADLVLPVASAWEREGLQAGFSLDRDAEAFIQLRPAVVPPVGESRSDTSIVFDLAVRLGLGDRFFAGDLEAGLNHVLEPTGLSAARLRADRQGVRLALNDAVGKARREGFATASGLVEIYSTALRGAGHDPLPDYEPPTMSLERRPDLASKFPLRLTCAKWPQFCHSQQRQAASLQQSMREPIVQMHPATAEARGIVEGRAIHVRTPHGWFAGRAKLTAAILENVICSQYGWWNPDNPMAPNDLNYNGAIDGEIFDPISGSNELRSYVCDVVADDPTPSAKTASPT